MFRYFSLPADEKNIKAEPEEGKCEDWTKGKRKQHHEDWTGEGDNEGWNKRVRKPEIGKREGKHEDWTRGLGLD